MHILLRSMVFLAMVLGHPAFAKDFFVDPHGATGGNGTVSAPFQSLKSVLAAGQVNGGDRIVLAAGDYGPVTVKNAKFDKQVHIIGARGATVHFDSLFVKHSSNIRFADLQVWPTNPKSSNGSLVLTSGDSSSIEFDNLDIRSQKNAASYRQWSHDQWLAVKIRGVVMNGSRNTFQNSQVTGTFIAISAKAEFALISGNRVSGFSGDAMRALGDFSLVTGNYVEDCVDINSNHDDGFQSWSRGPNGKTGRGVVRGLTVQNNIILEWNGTAQHPLRCSLQGIGLFDGMFQGVTIQNNLVSVSAYHGLSVAGALDARIINNTVINATGAASNQPWISIAAHKNGTPPQRVLVANNVAMRFRLPPIIAQSGSGNITIDNPVRVLNDPFGNDFRPRPGSPLIGQADENHAPSVDVLGISRPQGSRSDVGAFEVK